MWRKVVFLARLWRDGKYPPKRQRPKRKDGFREQNGFSWFSRAFVFCFFDRDIVRYVRDGGGKSKGCYKQRAAM